MKRGRNQSRDRSSNTGDKKCYNCGMSNCKKLKGAGDCPAKDKKCNACGKTGHYGRVCKSGKNPGGTGKTKTANAVYRCNDVTADRNRRCPTVSITMAASSGETLTRCVTPDTGAEITVAPVEILEEMDIPIENTGWPTVDDLTGPSGEPLESVGTLRATLWHGDYSTEEDIHICKGIGSFLLSWYSCKDLGMIPQDFPAPMPKSAWKGALVVRSTKRSGEITISENPDDDEVKIVREKILEEYKDVFHTGDSLKMMDGEPMKIHLAEDATPFALHAARTIPLAYRDATKAELDNMVKTGVITEVHHPTDWVHPIVVVPKPKGGVRLCVDLTKLNKHVKRPFYPMKTPRDVIATITPGAKFFSTLDATKGYWQIPLAEESQDYTTFITPWGRYKFLRAVMGLSSSQDEYERRGNEAVGDIPDIYKIVDDILCATSSAKKNLRTVLEVLERCRKHKVTLSPEKFHFCQPEVQYVGFILSEKGTMADPAKVKAITDFPTPSNLTDLRSFFGLVNQLGDFSTGIAEAGDPLRPLLRTKNVFRWEEQHTEAFNKVKETLSSPPILAAYDPSLPTMLQTDASRLKGLGYALLQQHDTKWRLIQCGSRFITETESRYSMIELELLGVVWAARKCKLYLQGLQHFDLIVDHKPLVPILNSYTLDMIETPRIQRLKEKLQLYNFTATWRKGKEHAIPDALSRAPVLDPTEEDKWDSTEAEEHTQRHIRAITVSIEDGETESKTSDPIIEEVRMAAKDDNEYQALIAAIQEDFREPEHRGSGFYQVRDHLSIDDGIVLHGSRIVIPKALRREMLQRLHSGHQGIERTLRRARQSVFWPGLTSDVTNTVRACSSCQERLPSNVKEPLRQEETPSRPFESASADLFSYAGKHYLVYVDRLSGWPSSGLRNEILKLYPVSTSL